MNRSPASTHQLRVCPTVRERLQRAARNVCASLPSPSEEEGKRTSEKPLRGQPVRPTLSSRPAGRGANAD